MQSVVINLPDVLYAELETAAASVRELGFRAETWAQEAVEAALATRRMPARVSIGPEDALARRAAPEIQEDSEEL